jgi:mono/diheme cytochrome c family protein
VLLAALPLTLACRQDMHDQPRYKPLAGSDFFGDGRSARPLVAGTVARGHLKDDAVFHTGKTGDAPTDSLPFPVTGDVLRRGQQRYRIFCTPCHGQTGRGDGMVVRRGYRKPVSFHDDRLRGLPAGYFFDVMTNGFGAMPDYASQIPPGDRWAIVAYVRALQLSQHAPLAEVPEARRGELGAARP